jgi:hypothetical protein
MSDRDWMYVAGFGLALAVLWYAWRTANPPPLAQTAAQASGAFPEGWSDPMIGVYNANPQAFQPPTQQDLTVNVGDQAASMLTDAYMPLFGFVGVAQGMGYQ